jgi:hypothetical protein
MTDAVRQLQSFVLAHPAISYFAPPATRARIAEAEATIGLELPEQHRQFLLCFNGGFILPSGCTADPTWGEDNAPDGSIHVLGLRNLVEEYREQSDIWTLDRGWKGTWPYVPFCRVLNGELLVFAPANGPMPYAVLDAWHEVGPREWRPLHPDFNSFLTALVAGRGEMDVVAKSG